MCNCAFKGNLILFFNCNLTDNLFLTVKKRFDMDFKDLT